MSPWHSQIALGVCYRDVAGSSPVDIKKLCFFIKEGLVNSSKFLGKVGSEKKEEKSGKPRLEKLSKDTK